MKHRISAGVIVEDGDRLLLVHNQKPGAYDFWVAPGGGVEGGEDIRATARREAREECGLEVEPLALAYIEELTTPELRICKFWFTGRIIGGALSVSPPEASAEQIIEAAFLSAAELEGKTIFPNVLRDIYWQDRRIGFAAPRYLGMRAMEVY